MIKHYNKQYKLVYKIRKTNKVNEMHFKILIKTKFNIRKKKPQNKFNNMQEKKVLVMILIVLFIMFQMMRICENYKYDYFIMFIIYSLFHYFKFKI